MIPAAQGITFTDRAAWEVAVGSWADVAETWAGGSGSAYSPFPTGSTISLPLSGTTITFDQDLNGAKVGLNWGTWSGGNTPKILVLLGNAGSGNSVGATASASIDSFGVEMEPNFRAVFEMTLVGGGTITQFVDGNGGAKFFGWAQDPVIGFTMTIEDSNANGQNSAGFGFGRMVEGQGNPPPPVPDGGSLLLVSGFVFLGMMGFARRRQS
jgi:hypothetical protein